MLKFRRYTKEQLIDAVKNSFSIASVLRTLGLKVAGGNYQTINNAVKQLNLDTSHFTKQGWLKGKTYDYRKRSLEKILVYGKFENSSALHLRLLKEKVKSLICEKCNRITWTGKPIPLELHHKDGDRLNNRLDNIELLCPNCHALTDNYRGKNQERYKNKGM